jgi:nucleotide-binding universal stress UspA family protein
MKIAQNTSANLLVVGRRGAGTLRKLLLGSTAERVVHAGYTSVLIVGSQPDGPYRAPLVATIADESSRYVIDAAIQSLPADIAKLEIVTAVTVLMEGWLWSGWVSMKEILRVKAMTRKHCERELDRLLGPYRETGLRLRITMKDGDPRKIILAAAVRRGSDLLVVGHAAMGIVRFHLGSVAAHIIQHAPCDVLVARPSSKLLED